MTAEFCFSILLALCRELCEAIDLIFISHFFPILSDFRHLVCISSSGFLT